MNVLGDSPGGGAGLGVRGPGAGRWRAVAPSSACLFIYGPPPLRVRIQIRRTTLTLPTTLPAHQSPEKRTLSPSTLFTSPGCHSPACLLMLMLMLLAEDITTRLPDYPTTKPKPWPLMSDTCFRCTGITPGPLGMGLGARFPNIAEMRGECEGGGDGAGRGGARKWVGGRGG